MQDMLKKIILALAVLILALGAGFYIYKDLNKPKTDFGSNQAEQKNSNVCTEASTSSDCVKSAPNTDTSNSDSFNELLALGLEKKGINDYEGARDAWERAGVVSPTNFISFNNLGDLYAYYLKDNKKAEENFLTAIKNGPNQIYIYRSLYEFYRYVVKDDAKAKAILQRGITANPNISKDLKYLLDNL